VIRVNLVPKEILDKEAQKQQATLIGIGAGCVVLVLALVSASHYYKAVKLERELTVKKERLKKLEKIVKQVEALEAKANAVRARLNVMGDLLEARELYPRYMSQLLRTFPSGVWLTAMSTSGSDKGLAASLTAMSRTPEDISRWLRNLEDAPDWANPTIGPITLGAGSGKGNSFNMNVIYKPVEKK
jgi:Tfp pilus assembly protein PilN